jgi:sigma-B regulation protein RsbU (phosphoserine phosphatase)
MAERQRDDLAHEIQLAAEVQQSILPRSIPAVPGFEFAARMYPAKIVAGDYYGVLCAGTLRVMRSVIYGVSAYDAQTLGTVVLTLVPVTLLATTLPILRIATIDPANTLREE